MSRSNQYTKTNSGALNGAPVGEFTIDVDLATAGATEDIDIHDEFSLGAQVVSCQVISIGLTGVLDGAVDLTQSNDGANFDLIGVQSPLDVADGSDTLEKEGFGGKFLGLRISKSGVTGGIVRLSIIVKHK